MKKKNDLNILVNLCEEEGRKRDWNFTLWSDDGYWFAYWKDLRTLKRTVDSIVGVETPAEAMNILLNKLRRSLVPGGEPEERA